MARGFRFLYIAFLSLTESIDTATPTGRAMWQMVGILAELERSLIGERTKAGKGGGNGARGEDGAQGQANPTTSRTRPQAVEQGEHHDTVAKSLGVSRRTLYRALEG